MNVLQPGRYTVSIDYACSPQNEGSEWEINGGESSIRFCALPSGQQPGERRMRYRTVDCGVITLTAGRQEMTLSPKAGGISGDIGVRALHLRPWR